ncbi:hypothetical protein M404DRAFT_996441 [Pisolithus tinctorius Marx 270]|uniref:Uncharacterized protein n=1 Tax=Pisolithus tinctorius Marx 270 TaxID=870435 RepID=A0A0C3KJ51_PISTI|nr:hypothetical protein M404DRAFT_996441 [Pisolithus tinctorius Marx 270]
MQGYNLNFLQYTDHTVTSRVCLSCLSIFLRTSSSPVFHRHIESTRIFQCTSTGNFIFIGFWGT